MKPHLGTTAVVLFASLAFAGIALPDEPGVTPSPEGLSIEPETVEIGLLFEGSRPVVRAEVPAGQGVAVRLSGARETLHLKRKGKVWGLLWVNVAEVELDGVPAVYFLDTTGPLSELTRGEPSVGYGALAAGAGDDAEDFDELVRLKEGEGLYRVDEGGAKLEPGEAGKTEVVASFELPARIPAGEYTVDVLGFADGATVPLASSSLLVEHAGLARSLRELALEHGLLYGCAAVLVALVAGVVAGFVFDLGSGKGH